jgi:hypothetical protein
MSADILGKAHSAAICYRARHRFVPKVYLLNRGCPAQGAKGAPAAGTTLNRNRIHAERIVELTSVSCSSVRAI